MEQGIYEMVKDAIQSLGFPIFVAVFLLWRDAKKMDMLISVIQELKGAVEELRREIAKERSS